MLQPFPINMGRLPLPLKYHRSLEYFEGDILSEWLDPNGRSYVEKWCAQEEGVTRSLVVRSSRAVIESYIIGQISLGELLSYDGGVGYIVDRKKDCKIINVYLINICDLPNEYRPCPKVYHDPTLKEDNTT